MPQALRSMARTLSVGRETPDLLSTGCRTSNLMLTSSK